MSRESERLFDLLGGLDEAVIEKAGPSSKRPPIHYRRYAGIAACFAVMFLSFSLFPRAGCGSSGGGRRDAEKYMSYFGPVLPLASMQQVPQLETARKLTFDFAAPFENEQQAHDEMGQRIKVQDEYTLKNTSDVDCTVELIYPFAGSPLDEADRLPAITKDGEPMTVQLLSGVRSKDEDSDGGDWVEFGKNNALQKALTPPQNLGRGIVYTVTGNPAPNDDLHHELRAEITADWSRSGWWGYGLSSIAGSEGTYRLALQWTKSGETPRPAYIIAVGDDFEKIQLLGKSWEEDVRTAKDDPNVTGNVTRQETDLDALLAQLGKEYLRQRQDAYWGLAEEEWEPLFMECLRRDAGSFPHYDGEPISDTLCEKTLEDLFMESCGRRLFAARFEITIPAGRSVQIKAEFVRDGSYDFVGEKQNEWGYDLLTRFDGNLSIPSQTLTLQNTQDVQLVRDNCGFDLENGKNTVTLDPETVLYELAVRRKAEK